ncbi:Hypothetical protein A7982_11978 [Minicystis rosea]|nr:Hypothetical protein A7982_11978 [Minicystis rosea]
MTSAPSIRTHEVRPPSARAETAMVARAAFHIVYWAALVVSAQTYDPARPQGSVASPPSPFERRFPELATDDQRMYRAIQEGVAEAERRRSRSGRWPSPAALAREGVLPFAEDPIDRAGYTWSFAHTGPVVNYVGTPAPGSGREAFAVIVTEPDPGTALDPSAQVDDVHHRLADGQMIHVTVWMGPPLGPLRDAVGVLAPDQGYKQVLSGR